MVRFLSDAGASIALTAALLLQGAGVRAEAPLTARLMGAEGTGDGPSSLRTRLLDGRNIQVLLPVVDGTKVGGRLLDPESVDIAWEGESLDQFLYYKTPQLALLFAILSPDALRAHPKGELLIRGRLHGSASDDLTSSVLFNFAPAEIDRIATNQARDGRSVLLLDPEKKPVGGGFLFGQRREDLYTLSDSEGVAILDRPDRSSSATHFAGREGFWTLSFDPVSSRTLTLQPRTETVTRPVELKVRSTTGEPISNGLLLVQNTYYLWWEGGAPVDLHAPPGREIEATLMVAGYSPQLLRISPNQQTAIVQLAPLAATSRPE